MDRYKGTFEIASNYEIQKAAPFDARQLVKTKESLTKPETWKDSNDEVWLFKGLITAVSQDVVIDNNGIYWLEDETRYQEAAAWKKLANAEQVAAISAVLNELTGDEEGSINNKVAQATDPIYAILSGIGGEGDEFSTVVDYVNNVISTGAGINLPLATMTTLGAIKLSEEIGVNDEGALKIKQISTDLLVEGESTLILNGGDAISQ